MNGRQLLFETDQRSLVQKMKDLIDHPSTLDSVREVAKKKLAQQLEQENLKNSFISPLKTKIEVIRTTATNLSEQDLEKIFHFGSNVTCRSIYNNLSNLKPTPSEVFFMKQGIIHMMVPPPFMNLTKSQYADNIVKAVLHVKHISCDFIEDKGYHFTISLI